MVLLMGKEYKYTNRYQMKINWGVGGYKSIIQPRWSQISPYRPNSVFYRAVVQINIGT